jgi:hypothetical protein
VIIARSQVQVGEEVIFFPAYDKEDFAVCFESHEAIDDVNSCLLHFSGPRDVVGFIEASFQFDKNRNLFFVVGGGNEGVEDGGITARSVKGHFDGEDLRVGGGLFQEGDDRLETFVGVVQEDVVLADGLETPIGELKLRRDGGG